MSLKLEPALMTQPATAGSALALGRLAVLLPLLLAGLASVGYVAQHPENMLQVLFLVLLVLPALLMGLLNSRFLLPYTMAVWIFAPELRRISDYESGHYTSLSLLNLAPLLALLTLLLPMMTVSFVLTRRLRLALVCFALALAYGGVLGILHNGLSALYDLANYILPLLVIPYAASRSASAAERDGWIRSLCSVAVIVAVYGWYQFIVAPPWDVFWMKNTEATAIGLPEPLKFRMFSTTSFPGYAANVFAIVLVPMLVERKWRGLFGWVGVALIASALLVTQVRICLLTIGLSLLYFVLVSRGRQRWIVAATIIILGPALYFVAPQLPGGKVVTERVKTLADLQKDTSYQQRFEGNVGFLPRLAANPFGNGIGRFGSAAKISNQGSDSDVFVDAGYLQIAYGFGFPGMLFLLLGLLFLWLGCRDVGPVGFTLRKRSLMARTALVSLLATLFAGNALLGLSGLLVWFFVAAAVQKRDAGTLETPGVSPGKPNLLTAKSRRYPPHH